MTARVPRLKQAEDAAAVHEVELSQVEDDRLPLNHDLVDLALEVLDACHIQLSSKEQSPVSDLRVEGSGAPGGHRILPLLAERATVDVRRSSRRRGLPSVRFGDLKRSTGQME